MLGGVVLASVGIRDGDTIVVGSVHDDALAAAAVAPCITVVFFLHTDGGVGILTEAVVASEGDSRQRIYCDGTGCCGGTTCIAGRHSVSVFTRIIGRTDDSVGGVV